MPKNRNGNNKAATLNLGGQRAKSTQLFHPWKESKGSWK